MVQSLAEQSFNSCAALGREILQMLKLREGRVQISLLADDSVRVERSQSKSQNQL